jgi:hypothetical protein
MLLWLVRTLARATHTPAFPILSDPSHSQQPSILESSLCYQVYELNVRFVQAAKVFNRKCAFNEKKTMSRNLQTQLLPRPHTPHYSHLTPLNDKENKQNKTDHKQP